MSRGNLIWIRLWAFQIALLSVMALAPHPAEALIPSPENSTCPGAVTVGTGACCFYVFVRDFIGTPIPGATVTIDFSACPVTFCDTQPEGITVDVANQVVSTTTDAMGRAYFCICGSLQPPCTAVIKADGVPLCTVAADSCGIGNGGGVKVSSPLGDQTSPRIVSDGAGGAIITWRDTRPSATNDDIYAEHVLPTGAVDLDWPLDGRALCTAAGTQSSPAITSDGAGGAIVAWEDFRNGNSDIYAQHVLASGDLDPGWPASGVAVCTAMLDQGSPTIVSDGDGGAIVIWRDGRSGTGDIYAQRVRHTGLLDEGWPIDGLPVCVAGGDQSLPRSVSDDAGGAIVSWYDFRNGGGDVYAQRIDGAGEVNTAWPVNGQALCNASGDQSPGAIVSDRAGGAIVVWKDSRGSDDDIYAQRVLVTGAIAPGWPADGRGVCTAALYQREPTAVSDGAGGAIIAWKDNRGGSGTGFTYDIYAQRLWSTGIVDVSWPPDGQLVCEAPDNQEMPAIAEDGAGGAIITWQDRRNGVDFDLYAQHVLEYGQVDLTWPIDGAAVSFATNHQRLPVIVFDGADGAIVAWQDRRSGTNEDIYDQHVSAPFYFQGLAHHPLGNAGLVHDDPQTLRITNIGSSGEDGVRITLPEGVSALRSHFELGDESSLPAGAYLQVSSRASGSAPQDSLGFIRMTRTSTPGQYELSSAIAGVAKKVVAVFLDGNEVYSDLRDKSAIIDAITPRGTTFNDALETGPLSPLVLRWGYQGETEITAITIVNRPNGAPDTTVTGDELRITEPDPPQGNYVALSEFLIRGKDLGEIVLGSESSRTVGVPRADAKVDALWLAPPAPNPSRDGTGTFAFRLAKEDLVTFEIIDLAGRRIERAGPQSFAAGTHALQWHLHGRAPGLYFVRLSTGSGESMIQKWAVLR